ncbi:MAG: PEP-CTERM sorting domain-containing protein [Acidobacteriia bacterium]|nr:PEP-CTERM sorting domain-containing protein [Terriglobia bacterium]
MSLAYAVRIASVSLFLSIASCMADTIINFEPPLPGGLTPVSYLEDTPVTLQARITTQYGNLGVLLANAALVNLGLGHATSGTNGIAGISAIGTVDYGSPVIFTFVDPLNNTLPWVTNHFAISTDQAGGSMNTTTLSAYGIAGNFLGSVSHLETGGSVTLQLQGIGGIHTVIVSSTLINHLNGGIGLDDVRFGPVSPTPVPEPSSYALTGIGLACLYWLCNRSKKTTA